MTPEQAIAAAAADPDDGVKGRFAFVVKGLGEVSIRQGRIVFLDSEQDHRLGANIAVQVLASTVKALELELGGPLTQTMIGKRVQVDGTPRQTKIGVAEQKGEKPFGYCFRTRIPVTGPEQVKVLQASPEFVAAGV
jgi:hypothetical protein